MISEAQKESRRARYAKDPQKYRDIQNARNQDPKVKEANKESARRYREQKRKEKEA